MSSWKNAAKVLIDEEAVKKRIEELGAQITADYKGSGRPLLLIGILRGSVVFFADLMRAIDLGNVIIDFMAMSSYGSSHEISGEVRVLKDLDESMAGKDVIIVEDIIDTGLTLDFLKKLLKTRNPVSLRTCCLLDKPERRKVELTADYAGFAVPNEFVIGFGLDYAQKYRNLRYIGALEQSEIK